MLAIVATLRVGEGRNAEFEDAMREAMAAVRANEPGNSLYQVVKSKEDPQVYRVLELYEDEMAIAAHRASAHFQALTPMLKAVIAERPVVERYETI